eukprot:TRINITY_DN2386_c0_g1_i1.p2 TRINITY_DN2386_c0_g1~~TRINITY_DN2386_c0_g1_i1.p2  ORF type:complete len:101 (-),score=8.28 TRINITY_DN2386_c0_g1_i1:104-406(-)
MPPTASADPRRLVNNALPFKIRETPAEEFDAMAMFSLMFGMIGLFMKLKFAVWQAFLCCLMSVANMKNVDTDMKHMFSSFSLSVMGLIMAYFGPQAKTFR